MTTQDLIEELRKYPPTMQVEVFVDWPSEPEEQSGWFKIDRVRPGGEGVQIELEQ